MGKSWFEAFSGAEGQIHGRELAVFAAFLAVFRGSLQIRGVFVGKSLAQIPRTVDNTTGALATDVLPT